MLEQEIKNLFRLIETWEKENIELAFQLIEGNAVYKAAVETRYLPILKILFNIEDLAILNDIKRQSIVFSKELGAWQPSAEQVEVLESMSITSVSFVYNKIEIFPKWICHLLQLTHLNLRENKIKKIPAEIGNLKQLEYLTLDKNEITDLPDTMGELKNLKRINLDFNQISELPDCIGNWSKLEWLCLEENKITALPQTILGLKSLTWLSIEKTPLGNEHHIHGGRFVRIHEPLIRQLLGLEGKV